MHDEMLERRLRATLREDARQLPFTITAAELERRLVLRDPSMGGRRLGLLLAAAVGIGLFGVGGAMGGLFDNPRPSLPEASPVALASPSAPATSPHPPVALVRELPGWQLSAGTGPDLAFDTGTQAFTGPGVEGGGPILIAVSCAGTGTIEVSVRLEHTTTGQVTEDTYAQFNARCEPDGATTSSSFATADAYVDVDYTTTAGTWVAVSILVPDPLPSPR